MEKVSFKKTNSFKQTRSKKIISVLSYGAHYNTTKRVVSFKTGETEDIDENYKIFLDSSDGRREVLMFSLQEFEDFRNMINNM